MPWFANKQIRKVIDSYALFRSATKGADHPFEQQVRSGEIILEIYPMGTLAEKYRAAGAGIPAFFTPVGGGSMVEEGSSRTWKKTGSNESPASSTVCPASLSMP